MGTPEPTEIGLIPYLPRGDVLAVVLDDGSDVGNVVMNERRQIPMRHIAVRMTPKGVVVVKQSEDMESKLPLSSDHVIGSPPLIGCVRREMEAISGKLLTHPVGARHVGSLNRGTDETRIPRCRVGAKSKQVANGVG